jgi:hypothetical protein
MRQVGCVFADPFRFFPKLASFRQQSSHQLVMVYHGNHLRHQGRFVHFIKSISALAAHLGQTHSLASGDTAICTDRHPMQLNDLAEISVVRSSIVSP